MIRYRFDRLGEPVLERRTFTAAFEDPIRHHYRRGDAIFAPRKESQARREYHALRLMRRAAKRNAGRDAARMIAGASR